VIGLVITAIGAVLGFMGVEFQNHETCSTIVEVLRGCHTIQPVAGLIGGGIAGGVIGVIVESLLPPPGGDPPAPPFA